MSYKLTVGHEEPTDEELLDRAIDMTAEEVMSAMPAPAGWDKVEAEQYDPPRPVYKEEDDEYILLDFV
jgi:hypothetical protein